MIEKCGGFFMLVGKSSDDPRLRWLRCYLKFAENGDLSFIRLNEKPAYPAEAALEEWKLGSLKELKEKFDFEIQREGFAELD